MIRCVVLAFLVACGPGVKGGPTMNNKIGGGDEVEAPKSAVVSADILAREPMANQVEVKHILIGWKDVGRNGKPADDRAKTREKAEAEALVKTILAKLGEKAEFEPLMKEFSEDPGSAKNTMSYNIKYDNVDFDTDFRMMSIRLHVDEIGVAESQFGFHIIKRVQ